MQMRVLVVEDDQDFIDELRLVMAELEGPPHVTVARSRDSAYSLLDSDFYDLVVLDLKIPTLDGALDANTEHGRAVFGRTLNLAPGTPVFVLTGSPVEDFVPEMLARARQVDIWGEGREVQTVGFLAKSKFAEAKEKLIPFARAVRRLSDVEVAGGDTELGIEDGRLVRIFAKRVGGVRCVGSLIGGGLTTAKVIRLKITDSAGAPIHDAIVKLGSIAEVRDESNRFDAHISRLAPGATPRKIQTLEVGAKARAAVFYGLADGFDHNAFDVCRSASDLPRRVKQATRGWWHGVGEKPKRIRDIRRGLVSDDVLQQITASHSILWLNDIESREIQTRWCCVHGDLHGANVLVAQDGSCVLIDFGDVGEAPAGLDPITLEFSLLFHPNGPLRGCGWPSVERAGRWGDLNNYLIGCPADGFIRACREWAAEAAAGQREVAACAYGYLVRQLKYSDTDKNLALALLEGAYHSYTST